jgi:thiol-disulfide isomerase/thioredoxin/outer membrane lipoprotein-sorting protein
MKAMLWLLPACLAAQTGSMDLVSGTWINENRETGGITQFTVRRDGGHTLVHAWGSCQPVDCDWGETEAELWNGIPMVIWKHGFSTTRMQLVPQPDGRALLAYRSEYNDESGRKDPGHAEFFARQEQSQDSPEAAAARALLKLVAETYRGLTAARFESRETVHRLGGKTEARTERVRILLFSAPDRLRIETRGSGEESILIEDGTTEWQIFPQSNEYVRLPQAKDISARHFGYRLLDKIRGTPLIAGREQFEGAGCTVVRIDLGRGVKQELWIDDTTHLVRKDLFDEPPAPSGGAARKSQTVYTVASTSETLDAALFTYDPAKTQAKSRTQLSHESRVSLVGKPAPEFTLRDLDNREVRLGDLRGKVVLLDFWGTWCGYCREALPSIEMLHRAGSEKGLAVFGVDAEAPELARDYLTQYGYTLRSLVDLHDAAAALYHVNSWPTTVLIDRQGNVAYYGEGEPEKMRDVLRKLGIW